MLLNIHQVPVEQALLSQWGDHVACHFTYLSILYNSSYFGLFKNQKFTFCPFYVGIFKMVQIT
jgi:hypothetical protein